MAKVLTYATDRDGQQVNFILQGTRIIIYTTEQDGAEPAVALDLYLETENYQELVETMVDEHDIELQQRKAAEADSPTKSPTRNGK